MQSCLPLQVRREGLTLEAAVGSLLQQVSILVSTVVCLVDALKVTLLTVVGFYCAELYNSQWSHAEHMHLEFMVIQLADIQYI